METVTTVVVLKTIQVRPYQAPESRTFTDGPISPNSTLVPVVEAVPATSERTSSDSAGLSRPTVHAVVASSGSLRVSTTSDRRYHGHHSRSRITPSASKKAVKSKESAKPTFEPLPATGALQNGTTPPKTSLFNGTLPLDVTSPHRPSYNNTGILYNATSSHGRLPSNATKPDAPSVNATIPGGPRPANTTTPNASSTNVTLPTTNYTFVTPLRGVNIGGWLVLEKWMNADLFANTDAADQYTFDATYGASDKLNEHWSTYFTESDMAQLASWGINAIRIPVGYWAYEPASSTSHITGADAYLEKAIGWARAHGIRVLVDCHGSPGSQNGFDNSGHAGAVSWQADDNLQKSIEILEIMAEKYGASEYADVVFGLELVNEPISWDGNDFTLTKKWAQEAYTAVKSKATNPDLIVVMHDAFMGPSEWEEVGAAVNGNATSKAAATFAVDVHLYQNMVASDSALTQQEHIEKACNWTNSELLPASSNLPVFVGEFSAATNVCANPDGTTIAGDSCYEEGCQCSCNVPIEDWNAPLVEATRRFLEAEMDAFEHSAAGWFMWNFKGNGAWGLENAVQYGLIGENVAERKYPGQCGF